MAAAGYTALVLILSATVRTECAELPGERVLLRKCCPHGQRLDMELLGCEDDPTATADNSSFAEGTAVVPEAAALERWIHSNQSVWESRIPWQQSKRTLVELLRSSVEGRLQLGPEPPCPPTRRKFFTWNSHRRYRLLSNGSLVLRSDAADEPHVLLPPQEYCTDNTAHDIVLFITCPCNKLVCVNKCCQGRKEMAVNPHRKTVTFECVDQPNKTLAWRPQFYEVGNLNTTVSDVEYVILERVKPVCDSDSSLVFLNEGIGSVKSMWPLKNGSALMEDLGHGRAYPDMAWCGEASVVGEERMENALVCQKKAAAKNNTKVAVAYGTLFAISAFFLLLTLVVYALLPELRRTAHARALMCHVAALLAGSVALASGQLRSVITSTMECYALGIVIQYSVLAAFFWLNVLCVDFARTFRSMLPSNSSVSRERRKFLYYSLYAWGCPAIISAITTYLEFAEGLPDTFIRPDFGRNTCWMDTTAALFLYFYGPMAILLFVNLVLYCYSTVQLVRVVRDTEFARGASRRSSGSSNEKREGLILHAKLFVVMGATWAMECVSAAVGQSDAYWYATDAVNMLRGVFVFVIFCCKRDIWRRLRERLSDLYLLAKSGGGNTGKTTSRSWDQTRDSAASNTTRSSGISLGEHPNADPSVSRDTFAHPAISKADPVTTTATTSLDGSTSIPNETSTRELSTTDQERSEPSA